jgi:hypothetical protein
MFLRLKPNNEGWLQRGVKRQSAAINQIPSQGYIQWRYPFT